MLHIDVVRQQRIRWEAQLTGVREQVLPTETGIDLLVGSDVVIQPGIKAVGIGRHGLQRFIVVAAPGATDIGQRVISVEQFQRDRIQHRCRNGVIGKGRAVEWIDRNVGWLAGGGADDGKPVQIAIPFRQRRHQILLRGCGSAAIALVIDVEKCLVLAAIQMRNGHRTAQAAAKRIESLGRLAGEVQNGGVQHVVLQIFEQTAVKQVGAAFGDECDVGHLGKFGAVVEGRDFEFGQPFRRRVGVL